MVRQKCLELFDLDIIGVVESHLRANNSLQLEDYEWIGHNRINLHIGARRGSGGVGCFVHKRLLQHFKHTVLDKSEEGILWIKLTAIHCDFSIGICVCYLPPDGTRYINPHDFYDSLIMQLQEYQQSFDTFFICGDFNGRTGNKPDFIEGVDPVTERLVIDQHINAYGEMLCDFLLGGNCCILNGRNCISNDFTYKNISVIDYCLVPYEQLNQYSSFKVHQAMVLFEEAGCVGMVQDPTHIIPDHNLLTWSIDLGKSAWIHPEPRQYADQHMKKSFKRYDTSSIADNFLMDPQVVEQINMCINRLEMNEQQQVTLNTVYDQFCDIVKLEMDSKLHHRTVHIDSGLTQKRRRVKKPYWSDELDGLWKAYSDAARKANRAHGREKQRLREEARSRRQILDRQVQSAKRRYWRQMQDTLLNMQSDNPKEYWNYIGKLGVGSERKKNVPWEVLDAEGNSVNDHVSVLQKWKDDFSQLLNSDENEYVVPVPDTTPPEPNTIETGLDDDISLAEVKESLVRAKSGKAVGYDALPVEVLRNESAILYLHRRIA